VSIRGFRSLLAVVEAGFEPRGIVVGAVAVQIIRPSRCRGFAFQTGEPMIYTDYEQMLRDAWRTAIERLAAEAVKVDAHGVVGVTVSQDTGSSVDGGTVAGTQQVLQLQLLGSAVRVRGEASLGRPFLSMLSMQETLKLLMRGWVPAGIAVGVSAVHVHGWDASPSMRGVTFSNAEMEVPTAGMALARARAEQEVRRALSRTAAEGAVAVDVQILRSAQTCGNGQGMLIEGRIVGTGVVRYRDPVVPISGVRTLSPAEAS